MKMCRIGLWALSLMMLLPGSASAVTIRHLDSMDLVDKHGKYFVDMLQLAMEKSADKYGPFTLKALPVQMRQDRQFKSLQGGVLDVVWSVTSNDREEIALPIRIPLLKGLIGNRVFVIDRKSAQLFAQANTLAELAKYTAVQGHDWPDAAIMEHAGLKVERIVWHSTMYKLISSGIVDYFPRSVLEVQEEIELANNEDLIIEPTKLLIYPSAIYFFVNKDETELAKRIEFGLKRAIADGSFDKLFYSFPGHYDAIRKINIDSRTVFRLDNPLLPPKTPVDNDALWLTPSK